MIPEFGYRGVYDRVTEWEKRGLVTSETGTYWKRKTQKRFY